MKRIVLSLLTIIVLVMMMLPAVPAMAADTGWKSPTVTGWDNEWTNPGNAYASDDSWATTDDDNDEQGYGTFGFSIPAGNSIKGIEVAVEVCSEDCDGCDLYVSLSWNNGSNYSNSEKIDLNCTEDTVYNLGGATDTWGRAWSLSELSDANFVAKVTYDDPDWAGCSYSADAKLDHIQVKVYYEPTVYHTITASAGANGTITPSGPVSVEEGTNQTFDITPNTGYIVSDVVVDLASQGRLNSYTFTDVTATHTIAASFENGWYQPSQHHSDWDNPEYAYTSDDNRARADSRHDVVQYSDFNIPTIPAGAAITGIEVAVEGYTGGRQAEIDLSWNDGNNYTSNKTTNMSGNETTRIFGGPSDTWGRTWSPGEFTNDNFRVRLDATRYGDDLYVDQLQVKVYYVEPEPNPTLSDTCGLDMVLVLDMSGSIDDAGAVDDVKDAAKAFVAAFLDETPSLIAVVRFSDTATTECGLTDNETTLNTAINGLSAGGYTNWEAAIEEATSILEGTGDRDDSEHADLIVIFTDGNPNRPDGEADAMAAAITAANAAKTSSSSQPIRIVAVGVAGATATNLIAISGPIVYPPGSVTEDTDVILSDFDDLADALADIASALCGGTITIHKVIDVDGDLNTTDDQISSGALVQSWQYSLTVSGGSATPTSGATDDTGTTVAFDISIDDVTATVTITETVKTGYDLFAVQQSGGSNPVLTPPSFSIDINTNDIVSVTFFNTPDCGPCEVFNPTNGQCEPMDCDDQDPCTIDTCVDGECVFTPMDCDDQDPCTIDTCVDGECVHTPMDCDDQDPCTIDTCVDGACVHTPNYPTADAGLDWTIYYGSSVEIGDDPTASGGTPDYTYSWTPITGLDDPTIANPTATPTSTTTYTVTVFDSRECSDSDSMTVTVGSRPVGPGGVPADECYLRIDMLGEIYRVEMSCCRNRSLEYCMALDLDELHFLEVEEGMEILCGDCDGCRCYPRVVVMSLSEEAPPIPEDMAVVGSVYDFTGYKNTRRTIECDDATFFDPPITVLLSYDPDDLPEGAFSPVIAFYDSEQGIWIPLSPDPGVVAEVGKVTGLAERFASPFAVLVEVPPPPPPETPLPAPAPANFVVSNLNIAPTVTKVGENVAITVNVVNDGGQQGTYLVELKINGETLDSKEVTLGAGQSEQVSFTVSGTEPGQYEVVVSGLSGEFTLEGTINWWLIGGIIAAVILLGWLVWYRKRR